MLLRPRQKIFVENCVAALKQRRNTLGVAPTGAGKTIMLSAATGDILRETGGKAAILAHRDELTAQNVTKFARVNPSLSTSIYDANSKSWHGRATFAMVPTLARQDNVIRITRHKARGVETEHPAVFPVRLPAFIMQAYSAEGEIVYEPFCGSGTTIIAGEQTGRAVRAMELAPAYVDVAVRRWSEIFPNAPIALEGEGTSFEETAAARGIDLTQESEAS